MDKCLTISAFESPGFPRLWPRVQVGVWPYAASNKISTTFSVQVFDPTYYCNIYLTECKGIKKWLQ